ncbi:MAG: hypothetical protein NTW62_01265 [Candidatus Nomurabacteria bacterium]|nr:hypothetical protein [Candidatus Nomurabacteria bacterium]
MNVTKKETKGGYIIEITPIKKIILSITSTGGNILKLNDIVVSNGRVAVPKGTKGRVVEIDEPFKDGSTDNVIFCEFEDGTSYDMKFKDLEFMNGSYFIK